MPEHSIVFCLCNSVGAFIGRPHGEPPYPIREDSMILKTHIMPEHSIVFCLCNSVGAFIGRPHGEPPYPIREDSMILKTHIMPERSIVFCLCNSVGENRVLPFVCNAHDCTQCVQKRTHNFHHIKRYVNKQTVSSMRASNERPYGFATFYFKLIISHFIAY